MNPVPATTQDGLVFLLVRFLLESSLPPVNEWINLNIGFKFEVRYVLSFGSMTIPSETVIFEVIIWSHILQIPIFY